MRLDSLGTKAVVMFIAVVIGWFFFALESDGAEPFECETLWHSEGFESLKECQRARLAWRMEKTTKDWHETILLQQRIDAAVRRAIRAEERR